MLRITEDNALNHGATLRLEGRLVGPWVELLQSSCVRIMQANCHLTLDLVGVNFADQEGLALLLRLQQQHALFINCSPFLQMQLQQAGGAEQHAHNHVNNPH